ncbi:head-tail connector protein [Aliihoeflea sp. PC F10.4]
MTAFRTTGPEAEPVTLAEAKAHLRLQHDSEDELVSGLIRAAREEVERATGLALLNQTWRKVLDALPRDRMVRLRPSPVREVLSVTVFGADGEGTLVDPAHYTADGVSRPARIVFRRPPTPGAALNGIEIDYIAGHGEAGADVPDLLKRAMLMLVAHWYEFRGVVGASGQPVSYPAGYDRLIAPFRQRRIA